jgi:hypothetical protein
MGFGELDAAEFSSNSAAATAANAGCELGEDNIWIIQRRREIAALEAMSNVRTLRPPTSMVGFSAKLRLPRSWLARPPK